MNAVPLVHGSLNKLSWLDTSKINNPCSTIVNRAWPARSNARKIDESRAIKALLGEASNLLRRQ
ncbi:MAG: hypothetical protein WAW39_14215 [Prosthecobacter sp.]|uniref:hypothetical protein n=1 Tax=Prosthecobacter sp. TaxID=1965333 RepID=UPI003BAEB23A